MASTKIINVLKKDDPEEILNIFEKSDAEEVIFIFPKGSKFARHQQYFELLKKNSDSSGKKVSIMTSDPVIASFALANDLDILQSPRASVPKIRESRISAAPQGIGQDDDGDEGDLAKNSDETEDAVIENDNDEKDFTSEEVAPVEPAQEPQEETEGASEPNYWGQNQAVASSAEYSAEEMPDVTLSSSKENNPKAIRDILGGDGEGERQLKVKTYKEPSFDLKIKRESFDENKENELTQMWFHKSNNPESEKTSYKKSGSGKISFFKKKRTIFSISIIVALIALAAISYSVFRSAQVVVYPMRQESIFQFKASASTTVSSVNLESNQIPGQKFTEQKEVSETFAVTGSKNAVQKASGKITIYNKGTTDQRLVATTRFESSDGKIFRIPATINVPAATKSGTNLIPGSIVQTVYADKPGQEYNIPAGKFTIPGFSGTPKFEEFYAISDSPMSGGIIGESKAITESDFSNAQEKLTTQLKKEIIDSLKSKIGELKIPDSISIKIDEPIVNAKAGEAANELKMTIKGSAEIIAFREEDAISLAKNYNLAKNKKELLKKDLTLTYEDLVFNAEGNTLSFNLKASGQEIPVIDVEKIKTEILGMSGEEIKNYFKNKAGEVESAKIKFGPFWVKSVPDDPGKVKVLLEKGE